MPVGVPNFVLRHHLAYGTVQRSEPPSFWYIPGMGFGEKRALQARNVRHGYCRCTYTLACAFREGSTARGMYPRLDFLENQEDHKIKKGEL